MSPTQSTERNGGSSGPVKFLDPHNEELVIAIDITQESSRRPRRPHRQPKMIGPLKLWHRLLFRRSSQFDHEPHWRVLRLVGKRRRMLGLRFLGWGSILVPGPRRGRPWWGKIIYAVSRWRYYRRFPHYRH